MADSRAVATTYSADGVGSTRKAGGGYVYDPKTGTWIPASPSMGNAPTASSQSPEDVPSSSTGNDSSSKVDSKTEADKKYIETEFNTLVGELVVAPSKKNIRIKVNDTVEVQGVGNHLSGKYFVSSVKRTLDKDGGYSQTLTVIKNGFGDSLKKASSKQSSSISREVAVEKSAPEFKVGDTVVIVGDAIYTNGKPIPVWVKRNSLTIHQISSDGATVLLMPISSWTYIRYVQKV